MNRPAASSTGATPLVAPRLVDVAERAGVSMKTVSNVINGFQFVSEQTRSRVQTAIDDLGYRPNLSARNLASGRAGLIALVVPKLDMPYFAAISGEVLQVAEDLGWFVLIHQTGGDLAAERNALAGRLGQRIDGMIVSAVHATRADIEKRDRPGPLVMLGERSFGHAAVHVGIDNVAAARTAVEHLIGLGRRRIAIVGPIPRTRNDRLRGYRQALTAGGLTYTEELVLSAPSNRGEEGEAALAAYLDRGGPAPDAVFCATDWLALGAIRALHLHGLRVPDDVAVVGFDDIPYGRVATPTLTTISPDRRQIARLAVESLVQQHQPEAGRTTTAQQHLSAGFTLVVRESTAGLVSGPAGAE